MKRDFSQYQCPLEVALALIGGKYKSIILWYLIEGKLRYSELSRKIPSATPKMLTQQLRELETDGLINRKVYPVVPPKVEYSLTDSGKTLTSILKSIHSWGEEYIEKHGISINCEKM